MYNLLIFNHGMDLHAEGEFKTFQELKQYLVDNTENIFGWIVEQDEETLGLPSFVETESLADIEYILDKYDYSWWTVTVDYR